MDKLIGMLIAGVIGWLVADTIVTIVKYIADRITSWNLGRYSKEALAANEETKNLLYETIQFEVSRRNGNVLSIDALRRGQKVAQIELRGESVADDVRQGMTIAA